MSMLPVTIVGYALLCFFGAAVSVRLSPSIGRGRRLRRHPLLIAVWPLLIVVSLLRMVIHAMLFPVRLALRAFELVSGHRVYVRRRYNLYRYLAR